MKYFLILQSVQKCENIKKILRNIVYDIERNDNKLKTFFQAKREKYEGVPINMSPLVSSEERNGYRNKCEFTIGQFVL